MSELLALDLGALEPSVVMVRSVEPVEPDLGPSARRAPRQLPTFMLTLVHRRTSLGAPAQQTCSFAPARIFHRFHMCRISHGQQCS